MRSNTNVGMASCMVGVASGAWVYPKIFRTLARPEQPPTDIPRNATV